MNLKSICLLLATAALSACGSGEMPPFTTTLTVKASPAAPLPVFDEGEPVTFSVAATNHTGDVLEIHWCYGPELLIQDAAGQLAWNALDGGGGSIGICYGDTYAPGEQRRWEWTWYQDYNDGQPNYEFGTWTPIVGEVRVPRGAYSAVVSGVAYLEGEYLAGSSSRPVDFLIR